MKRKLAAALFAAALVLGIHGPGLYATNNIAVTINNTPVIFTDQTPVIIDGRTLVPVADVFRTLGFAIDWDEEIWQVTLTNDEYRIVITIDSDIFFVNGVPHVLDVPAQIINGRTMLPMRLVLESAGYGVDWDGAAGIVLITYEVPRFENSDIVYVRGDGVAFKREAIDFDDLGLSAYFEDEGTLYGYHAWSLQDWEWLNYSLQSNGFAPMDNAILAWAFRDGPHPTERRQFSIEQVPLWYYYAGYRSQNPRAAVTNGYFATTFESFINTQARPNATGSFSQFWDGFDGVDILWTEWPPVNPQLDREARQALQTGFANDEIRHVFPFSPAFFNSHTNQTANHFWIARDDDHFIGLGRLGQIGIGIRPYVGYWYRGHANTAAHEIAHSLGLAEHLSYLFDEIMIGRESRLHASLYRTSIMDWVLKDMAGPVAFWEAVFWSAERYEELWQRYLGNFIPFETMQVARAGHEHALRNPHLQQSFMNSTGQEYYRNLSHISAAFSNAFNTNLPREMRDGYAITAQQEINSIANWARQQGLRPYEAMWYGHIQTRLLIIPVN